MFKSGSSIVSPTLLTGVVVSLLLAGCSSAELRARQEQRERVVQSSKLYCEFVNGDNNPDIDVALNLAMGAKCDADKTMTMTGYRTPSEINGVVFCCAIREKKNPETAKSEMKPVRSQMHETAVAPSDMASAPKAPAPAPHVNKPVVTPPSPAPVASPAVAPTPAPKTNMPPPSVTSEVAPSGPPQVEFVEGSPSAGQ